MRQLYIIFLMALTFYVAGQSQEKKPQQQVPSNKNLKLYPNPAYGDEVYLTTNATADKNVKVFDIFGEVVINTNLNTNRLNIASLDPGIYVLQVTTNEETASRKLVVK